MTRRRLILALTGVLTALAAVCWMQRQELLPAMTHWLDVGTAPHRVDCVFILPGYHEIRPFVAAAIVRTGLADRVVFPKNAPSPEVLDGDCLSSAEITQRVLEHRGVAKEKIVPLEADSVTTAQDLQALRDFLCEYPDLEVTVVTSFYHTRRARWLAYRVLGDDANRLSYLATPVDEFNADNWWKTPTGFSTIVSEYLKLIYVASQSPYTRWVVITLIIMSTSIAGTVLLRTRKSASSSPATESG